MLYLFSFSREFEYIRNMVYWAVAKPEYISDLFLAISF